MLKGVSRLAACFASGAAFLALTGCGGAAPDDSYAGPPPSSYDRGGSAPVLMGQTAPARSASDGLAGGPGGFQGMAPVPNPGDLTREERVKFYGHKYDYLPEPKRVSAPAAPGAPRFQLVTRRKADGTLQISMRPVANPEDMTAAERRQVYGNRYAPRATAAAPRRSWRTAAAAPAPVAKPLPAARPAPTARPVATAPLKPLAPITAPPALKTAPTVAPPAPAPAPALTPAQQLQTAVSATINRGATLSVPADLKAGKEADVVLSLPGDLLAMVQEQAAKLGLGKSARKVSAYANLKGDGYAITPPGQQTAPVAAGKPTTFTWKVKPTAGEKSPLTADYGLELKGAKARTAFSVGALREAVAAPVEAAKSAAKGFRLPKFGMPTLKALAFPWVPEPTLPGVGKVARENVVGGALALLALILLVVLARGASASRARDERRRKFRTMQDYGVNEQEHDAHPVTSASQGYVNPMVAAAAGAAGGYALASHGHDDHGYDDHGHGHDDHGHDDHGHGHDDHGQGHDDHGHGPAQHISHDAHGHGHDDHAAAHGHDDHAAHGHDDHGHGHDDHGHGHGHGHDDHAAHTSATPVSHDAHGHDDHAHGHDDHAAHGHDDHGHGADEHGHGHDDHAAHTAATPVSHDAHGHDDHGHGHDDHAAPGHDDHGHGHDDHGHGHGDHAPAHTSATPVSHDAPGHDDHAAHGHDDHGHGAHGHDDHGHGHGHGHDEHHKEPEHAH